MGDRHLPFSKSIPADNQSQTTVIIGRNGCGKSSLLRDLVMILRSISQTGRGRAKSTVAWSMIDRLDSVSNGVRESLRPFDKKADKSLVDSPDYSSALPERVIALSFTPYDKFPLDRYNHSVHRPREEEEEPFYVYLGSKAESGIASPRQRMLDIVGKLVHGQFGLERAASIGRTLEAIGYEPRLAIEYYPSFRLRDAWRRSRRDPFGSDQKVQVTPRAAQQLDLLRSELGENEIEMIFRSGAKLDLDIQSGLRDFSLDPRKFDFLVSHGVLVVDSIKLSRKESRDIDLMELSSGELNIFSAFVALAANLRDGCLVLIDEPENSLHPEWQIRYIEMLMAVLKQHEGCHYVIATHSPLIVSGASKLGSQILRLDDEQVEISPDGIANQSPDATLMNAFDVVTVNNSYLRQLLLEGMTLLEQGKLQTARGEQILAFLSKQIEHVSSEDPARKLIIALLKRGLGDAG